MDTADNDQPGQLHAGQSHAFQAEVAELLELMVHSVYSETEIFLRELVSNASDALDKVRYEALSRPELLAGNEKLAIRIVPDAAAKTLTVADSGIGMSRQELIDNLGTIARSGTRAFLKGLSEQQQGVGLIGQFGIGFYAAFMVADRIEVTSRRAGSAEAWTWSSRGGAGFEIAPAGQAAAARIGRGTEIVLHLKDDAAKYLDAFEIERIVRTWSDHILFPIELISVESGSEKGEARQVNSASALWQRAKAEVKPEDYTQAYRSIATAFDEPALTLHYKVEGRQSYAVLLFVPSARPFDLADPARKGRVKLYVRRVFITDDADLLPAWLRFVRGVVDSEDLPLNVSREMLQNNPQVAQMRQALTTRVLGELESAAGKDTDTFLKVWDVFGTVLKEGLYEDRERRTQLLSLCRFTSTAGEHRTLAQYVADMKPNQTEIYYLVGESVERLKAHPALEAARARGIEVLLLSDPIDAFWTMLPTDHEGKGLKSLSQGDVDFGLVPRLDGEKDKQPETDARADETLIKAVKDVLGDLVSDVRASRRLTDSAACLVASAQAADRHLDRLLARQNKQQGPKPVLELNPGHALVKALGRAIEDKRDGDVGDIARLLLGQAQMLEGEVPSDPADFARRLNALVVRGLSS